jgi:hypothetical protein
MNKTLGRAALRLGVAAVLAATAPVVMGAPATSGAAASPPTHWSAMWTARTNPVSDDLKQDTAARAAWRAGGA